MKFLEINASVINIFIYLSNISFRLGSDWGSVEDFWAKDKHLRCPHPPPTTTKEPHLFSLFFSPLIFSWENSKKVFPRKFLLSPRTGSKWSILIKKQRLEKSNQKAEESWLALQPPCSIITFFFLVLYLVFGCKGILSLRWWWWYFFFYCKGRRWSRLWWWW